VSCARDSRSWYVLGLCFPGDCSSCLDRGPRGQSTLYFIFGWDLPCVPQVDMGSRYYTWRDSVIS
jgi:hypothetical protein